jgi:hypothetical protein
MNSLEQKLIAAETEFAQAKVAYTEAVEYFKTCWFFNRAKAKEAKDDAERVVIRIQARIDQILKEKELAQGKFLPLYV